MEMKPGDWIAYKPSGFFEKPFALARVVKVTAKQIKVEGSTAYDSRIDKGRVRAIIGSDPRALIETLEEIEEQIQAARVRGIRDSQEAIARAASVIF